MSVFDILVYGGIQAATPVRISPGSLESLGSDMSHLALGAPSSQILASSNQAEFIPFRLVAAISVVKLFVYNGATVSGNIDVGIYDKDGNRLVSSGTTAQAGVNSIQAFDVTDTAIGPGLFYLAVVLDNATGTVFQWVLGSIAQGQALGLATETSAFPLPATATMTTFAATLGGIAWIGLSTRVLI